MWTVADLAFDSTPVIHEGVVYIRARTWAKDEKRLYAFDLKTGKQLWVSSFAPEVVKFFIGPMLFVTDSDGIAHSLDSKTGKDIFQPGKSELLSGTAVGNILYATWTNGTLTAADKPTHVLSSAQLGMQVVEQAGRKWWNGVCRRVGEEGWRGSRLPDSCDRCADRQTPLDLEFRYERR